MSKKSIFKLCLVIALATTASSAFGATIISGPLQIGGGTYSPSNKVQISYDAGPFASNCSQYVARSKHSAGDREIATTNTDPKMYYKIMAVTDTVEASVSSDTFGGSSWTSM